MDALLRDFRLAARNLWKHRGFTLSALLCLALGMGASSAMFSVVNAVLLKPLPFTAPERVVMIWNQFLLQDTPKSPASGREFFDLRSQNTVFDGVAAVVPQIVSLTGKDEPQELLAGRSSASLFPVLGVKAAVGRVYTAEEDVFGNNDVALLSDTLWRQRFAADPRIAGRKIGLDGRPFVVVGVLPAGFSFGKTAYDLWIPLGLSPERLMPRHIRTVTLVARLKRGVGIERAQAEMTVVARRFARDYPESYPAGSGYGLQVVPAHDDLVGEVRLTLFILFGAVGFVLVIACLNVANLLLTRSTSRSKEVAIRTALGSSRSVLIRQFLSEGLLLSLLGAGLGLLLAFATTRALVALNPGNIPRLEQVRLDGEVLLFTLGLVLLTGSLFGLVPALVSRRKNLRDPLQDGSKTSATTVGGQRTRSALVVAEIALALVVLVGTGLMIQSFRRLLEVNPGFRTQNLLNVRFSLTRARYPEDSQTTTFERQLLERVASLPGVAGAAITSQLPMAGGLDVSGDLTLEGRVLGPSEPPPVTGWRNVTSDYFKVMDIPLLQGRFFLPADDGKAPGVVILDRDLARRLWPNESPLNKRLKLNARTPEQSVWRTVVGVVGHVRQHDLGEVGGDQLYVPLAQYPTRLLNLVLRPSSAAASLASGVRGAVWAMDRDLPIEVRTIEQVIDESLTRQRFNMLLFVSFGLIALALTMIGVYGVMAYTVAQRTRDVGIRMALGARKEDVLRLVVRQGVRLALLGLAVGLLVAWSLSRLMLSLLYGIAATDAATFVAVSLLVGGLALAASYFPARRAAKVDPVVALRYD